MSDQEKPETIEVEPTAPVTIEVLQTEIQKIYSTLEEVQKLMEKIKRQNRWRTIFNVIWIVIVVGPIIASLFFIPTILQGLGGYASSIQQIEQLTK